MILVLGHVARVHPTANSPLCRCIVGVPSLWPRPAGVLKEHGMGVSRQFDSEQANFRVARRPLEIAPRSLRESAVIGNGYLPRKKASICSRRGAGHSR